jgi:hypothetical protein
LTDVHAQPAPEAARAPSAARDVPAPTRPVPAAQARIIQLQRTAGNRAVVQRLAASGLIARQPGPVAVQRAEGDEAGAAAAGSSAAGGGGAAGGTEINDTSVKITAGNIELNSPVVRVNGVTQTDTLIADAVIASSYTPGAGNVW